MRKICLLLAVVMALLTGCGGKTISSVDEAKKRDEERGYNYEQRKKELVSNAFEKSDNYVDDNGVGHWYEYAIPKINLDSEAVTELNQKIYDRYYEIYEAQLESIEKKEGMDISEISHSETLYNDYYSVLSWFLFAEDLKVYDACTVNIETKEVYTNKELIARTDYTEEAFLEKMKEIVTAQYKEQYKNLTDEETYDGMLEYTLSEKVLNLDNPMFVGDDGMINIVADIGVYVGGVSMQYVLSTGVKIK